MGTCTSTTSSTATAGPKIHPEQNMTTMDSPTAPAHTRPATSTATGLSTDAATPSTTTTLPTDHQQAALAQQEERARMNTADQERKQRVALFRATKDGDVEQVQQVLAQGANVNVKGMWDNTPLICACQYGYTQVAVALLNAPDCDVNAVNEKGCTALHHACIEGLHTLVPLLLEKGARSNVPPAKLYNNSIDKNETLDPLQAATAVGDVASVVALAKTLSGGASGGANASASGADDLLSSLESLEKALALAIDRNVPLAIAPLFATFHSILTALAAPQPTKKYHDMFVQACTCHKEEQVALALLDQFQAFNMMDAANTMRGEGHEALFTAATCHAAIESNMCTVLKRILDSSDDDTLIDEQAIAKAQQLNNPDIMALLPANPQ